MGIRHFGLVIAHPYFNTTSEPLLQSMEGDIAAFADMTYEI
jgi:hypothetical protein